MVAKKALSRWREDGTAEKQSNFGISKFAKVVIWPVQDTYHVMRQVLCARVLSPRNAGKATIRKKMRLPGGYFGILLIGWLMQTAVVEKPRHMAQMTNWSRGTGESETTDNLVTWQPGSLLETLQELLTPM